MPKRRKLNSESSESPSRILPRRSYLCPICSISIPAPEVAAHYKYERNLFSTPQAANKRPAAVLALAKIVDRPRLPKRNEVNSLLYRVRANREARRKQERIEDEGREVRECPICGLSMAGIGMSVSEHVSSCLDMRIQEERREQGDWEVYEVAGQTRVRAMTLLEGGIQSLPNAAVNTDHDEEMEIFVDVEGDTEAVYGRTQYTEADLLNPEACSSNAKPSGLVSGRLSLTIDLRCNICLNAYSTPVISVQCFHAYCEKCWLQALQSQKLCPQCRIITQPSDLRRVYL